MGVFSAFKKISDNAGKIATVSGLLLFPFFCAAAGATMAASAAATAGAATSAGAAAATATNGAVLTSFWKPLVTDFVTGEVGLMPGLTNMFNGAAALAMSGFDVAANTIGAMFGEPTVLGELSSSWNAPAAALTV